MEKHQQIIYLLLSIIAMVVFGTLFSITYAKLFEQIQKSANTEAEYLKTSDKYTYAIYKDTQKQIWLYTLCAVITGFATGVSIIVFLFSLMLLKQI